MRKPTPLGPPLARRWALMRRHDIADLNDTDETYLTRFRIIQTPWFGWYVHIIRKPDGSRDIHDHPWSFITIVLNGGYEEERPGGTEIRGMGSVAVRRTTDRHRVARLLREPTWTMLFVGRRKHHWGFYEGGRFIPHEVWYSERFGEGT